MVATNSPFQHWVLNWSWFPQWRDLQTCVLLEKQNVSLVNGPELCWENLYESKLDNSQVSDSSDITHIAKNQKHLQDFDDKDR